ncbi:Hint domain-containing protein, partial [Salmonella enterica]|uniref:Hint domain-containing protein n=1 Tax=Salmonella enterica TaxID=28901 RepID=UPI003CF7CCAC
GDTPVLMADGSERPLRDIRPGDEVATYEGGRLTTSTVKNWRNNGPDSIYRIRMKSGVEVRANARHPFLTVKDGNETWTRL